MNFLSGSFSSVFPPIPKLIIKIKVLSPYTLSIALLPLIAFLLIISGFYKKRALTAITSISAVGIGFILSLVLLFNSLSNGGERIEQNFTWLKAGDFHLDVGVLTDPLAIVMLIVVTSVSLLVQIYSHGYMNEDPGYAKFYSYLSLFTASMLGLVISTNLFQIYIFWELVGLCSYLLIGFWSYKPSAAAASMKAFIVNRVGDCGLLLGILLFAFATQGMWNNQTFLGFAALPSIISQLTSSNIIPVVGVFSLTTIALLMLLGPMAKSAQFPLHVWLPDAMEGPTPISALIHAATMVAAGVYLLARIFPIYEAAPPALVIVTIIGAITAIFSATIALSQNDIKKALAYSTCSQLGYMVMSVGLGNWIGAMFHLVTHAFFKALLFLGSGSVIHGCHHEQDMNHFGGLSKKMPITHITFLIGTLAISGVPGLAGFWSKERIIGSAWESAAFGGDFNWVFWTASITAGLTAFYMFRIYFKTFAGEYKGHEEAHESPKSILIPLIALSIPSILIGLTGTHLAAFGGDLFGGFLQKGHEAAHTSHLLSFGEFVADLFKPGALIPLTFSLGGILLSYLVYGQQSLKLNEFFKSKLAVLHKASQNKWYIDEMYAFAIQKLIMPSFVWTWKIVDRFLIDTGLVGGVTQLSKISGWIFAQVQSGRIQTYIGIFFLGFIALAALSVLGKKWGIILGTPIELESFIDNLLIKNKGLKP
jgi:proton-translocating NADH-quinone oxidoreductase chain L